MLLVAFLIGAIAHAQSCREQPLVPWVSDRIWAMLAFAGYSYIVTDWVIGLIVGAGYLIWRSPGWAPPRAYDIPTGAWKKKTVVFAARMALAAPLFMAVSFYLKSIYPIVALLIFDIWAILSYLGMSYIQNRGKTAFCYTCVSEFLTGGGFLALGLAGIYLI